MKVSCADTKQTLQRLAEHNRKCWCTEKRGNHSNWNRHPGAQRAGKNIGNQQQQPTAKRRRHQDSSLDAANQRAGDMRRDETDKPDDA